MRFTWLLLVLVACGESDNDPPSPDAQVDPGDWQLLVDTDWEAKPGGDTYLCVRKTVLKTTYLHSFRAIAPTGTHHTVLTVGDPSEPDGTRSCDGFTNEAAMIYGSGVDTNPIDLPEGVAIKVEAGQQLHLNLHLFNTTDNVMKGRSGVEFKAMPAEEVQEHGEGILAGKTIGLNVPPGETTQVGRCKMNGDTNIIAVAPHMHQLGTHMKVVADTNNGEVVLHDDAYDFYEQKIYLTEPLALKKGQEVRVYCTYNNSGKSVGFGESSDDEMCFAGLIRYPAYGGAGSTPVCDSDLF